WSGVCPALRKIGCRVRIRRGPNGGSRPTRSHIGPSLGDGQLSSLLAHLTGKQGTGELGAGFIVSEFPKIRTWCHSRVTVRVRSVPLGQVGSGSAPWPGPE